MKNLARGLLPITAATLTFPALAAQGGSDTAAAAESADKQQRSRSTALEEVFVTAQRRRERLLETPISVGVMTSEDLEKTTARGVADALRRVPGVAVSSTNATNPPTIFVRGVNPGVGANTTGFYLDEVPYSRVRGPGALNAGSFDLARVEVLRGPQGTLYGAGAMTGVVRVVTTAPNLDAFEARGRALSSTTQGGGENYGADLALNVPVVPGVFAVRGVASYQDLSGYIDSTNVADPRKDFNDSKLANYRLAATWQATSRLSARLIASRLDVDANGNDLAFADYTAPFRATAPLANKSDVVNLIATYDSDKFSILSSTGYLETSESSVTTAVLGQPPVSNQLTVINGAEARSEELRVVSRLDGPWQWTAGAFYRDQTDTSVQRAVPLFCCTFNQESTSETTAYFGEITRSFYDERLEITAGLRETYVDQGLAELSTLTGIAPLPPDSGEFDATSWRLVAAFHPEPNSTIYGSVGTGHREGQLQSLSVRQQNPTLANADPDELINYEIGAKGHLFGDALIYQAAVYYMDWTDIQQNILLPLVSFTARVNAGDADGFGGELGLSTKPFGGLSLWTGVAWNGLELGKNVLSGGSATLPPVLLFREGDRVNSSPEWTGSVGFDFERSMGGSLSLVASGTYSYGSERLSRTLSGRTVTVAKSDNIDLMELSIGIAANKWSVRLVADNLLEEHGAFDAPNAVNSGTAPRPRPRTIGIQFSAEY